MHLLVAGGIAGDLQGQDCCRITRKSHECGSTTSGGLPRPGILHQLHRFDTVFRGLLFPTRGGTSHNPLRVLMLRAKAPSRTPATAISPVKYPSPAPTPLDRPPALENTPRERGRRPRRPPPAPLHQDGRAVKHLLHQTSPMLPFGPVGSPPR